MQGAHQCRHPMEGAKLFLYFEHSLAVPPPPPLYQLLPPQRRLASLYTNPASWHDRLECPVESVPPLQEFKHPGHLGVSGGRSGGGRKKRCKPADLICPLTLTDINQKIMAFVQGASDVTELKFNFVSRAFCKTISSLAQVGGEGRGRGGWWWGEGLFFRIW